METTKSLVKAIQDARKEYNEKLRRLKDAVKESKESRQKQKG